MSNTAIDKDKLLKNDVTHLLSGEKRRILLLRGLMSNKSTIIVDEQNSANFWEEILRLDKTIIVVSHDTPRQYQEQFDKIYNFNDYVLKSYVKI